MQNHRLIAFVGAIAFLTTLASAYAASAASSATKFEIEEWRKSITRSTPPKAGCFTLQYPSKKWKEVDCGKQPPDAPQTLGPKEFATNKTACCATKRRLDDDANEQHNFRDRRSHHIKQRHNYRKREIRRWNGGCRKIQFAVKFQHDTACVVGESILRYIH